MSANNFILIRKSSKGVYGVQHCDADTGDEHEFLGKFDRLEDAIDCANKFRGENEVEYGLNVEM